MSVGWTVASCAVSFGVFRQEPVRRLEDAGCTVRVNPYGRPMTAPELVEFAQGADAVVLGNDRLTAATMNKLPDLKLIVRHGAGVDTIAFDYAMERGIVVANTPGDNAEDTADLTFGLILDLERNITQSVNELRNGRYRKICGHSLYGKTIGIVGVGNIGLAVARRAMGFGMDILGNDIFERPEAGRYGLMYVGLNDLLAKADVVTLHTPLTSATQNLIGARELRRMKRNAVLVNTARAKLIREAALIKALETGEIMAYGADVTDKEPPDHNAMFDMPNVLITPHLGSATYETNLRMGMDVADNIIAAMEGREPPGHLEYSDLVQR